LTSETTIDAIARAREAITKGGKALLSRLVRTSIKPCSPTLVAVANRGLH